MSENRMRETNLRDQQETATSSVAETQPSGHLVLKIVGGAVLALAGVALISSLRDIRRYIRISRM